MTPEEKLQFLNEEAEKMFPSQIQELAQLTGQSEELVLRKIEYMQQIGMYASISKYVVADILLTFHRIQFK